jgi:glycosyltransferase involved in cell wall biosynthesis
MTDQSIIGEKQIRPYISVLIPVFNSNKTLKKCLDSVVNQVGIKFEVIVVDDGSTDHGSEVINNYLHLYNFKFIKHNTNRGLIQARISGIKESIGEFIIFLDSDDELISPNSLASIYAFTNNNNSEIFHFYSEIYDVVNNHRSQNNWSRLHKGKISANSALEEMIISRSIDAQVWGKLYKADVMKKSLDKISLPEGLSKSEDVFFNCIFLSNSQHYTGVPFKFYRYNYGLGMTAANRKISCLNDWRRNISGFVILNFLYDYFSRAGRKNICNYINDSWFKSELDHVMNQLKWVDEKILKSALNDLYLNASRNPKILFEYFIEDYILFRYKYSKSVKSLSFKFKKSLKNDGLYATLIKSFNHFNKKIRKYLKI